MLFIHYTLPLWRILCHPQPWLRKHLHRSTLWMSIISMFSVAHGEHMESLSKTYIYLSCHAKQIEVVRCILWCHCDSCKYSVSHFCTTFTFHRFSKSKNALEVSTWYKNNIQKELSNRCHIHTSFYQMDKKWIRRKCLLRICCVILFLSPLSHLFLKEWETDIYDILSLRYCH